jgi:hypothetical protein
MSSSLTPKQLDKFKRQRYIHFLEKAAKSLFSMFRDESVTQAQFLKKFAILRKKIDQWSDVSLDGEYLRALQAYVGQLTKLVSHDFVLHDIRAKQMTQLNRIQKIKNSTSYTRERNEKYDDHH